MQKPSLSAVPQPDVWSVGDSSSSYNHFKEVMCDTKKILNISYLYSEAEETDLGTSLNIF